MRRFALILALALAAGCGAAASNVAHPTTCQVVRGAIAACAQLPTAEAWACAPAPVPEGAP